MNPQVPPPDPLPMPGPAWLFHVLLLVTFTLHVAAMNGLLGGGFLAALALTRGREGDEDLARRVLRALPVLFAATVTLGVAPLLFAQVLFGRLLYTSSVLLAWPWFSVVGAALVAYALTYALSRQARSDRRPSAALAWTVVALLVWVAFVFVNDMTLMLDPDRWKALYLEAPGGAHLALGDAQVIPRALHMLTGALAVGALVAALLVRARRAPEAAAAGCRTAVHVFAGATGLQIVLGSWFLLSQPERVRKALMGHSLQGTVALSLGIVLAVAALVVAIRALRRGAAVAVVPRLATITGAILVLMVLVRDDVRRAWLAPAFVAADQPADTQGSALAVFLVVFVLGLGVLAWLVRLGLGTGREDAAGSS